MSARRAPQRGTIGRIVLLFLFAASGCSRNGTLGTDPTEDLHQELLRQATDEYTLVSAAPSVTSDALVLDPKGKARNIQLFAFKMSNPNVTSPPRFVAAFLSTKNHQPMGLRKGMNYILEVRKADGTTGYVMVPDDEKADMSFLRYAPVSNDPNGAPHAIRNVAGTTTSGTKVDVDYLVGGCVEGCATGHCGFSLTDGNILSSSNATDWGVPLMTR